MAAPVSIMDRAIRVLRREGLAGVWLRLRLRSAALRQRWRWVPRRRSRLLTFMRAFARRRSRLLTFMRAPASKIALHIDQPPLHGGSTPVLSGREWIHGWAVASSGIDSITVQLDATELGAAHVGLSRPDIAALFPDIADAWRSGFVFPLDTSGLADGAHTIAIAFRSGAGEIRTHTRPIEIDNTRSAYDRWLAARRIICGPDAAPAAAAAIHFAAFIGAGESAARRATLDALTRQTHADWHLVTDPGGHHAAPAGTYLLPLSAGDLLEPHALAALARAAVEAGGAELVYGDEDRIDRAGRRASPLFKPGWSPTLLLACNYLGRPWAVSAEALAARNLPWPAPAADAEHALLLRLAEAGVRAVGIADVLCSRPIELPPGSILPVRQAVERRGGGRVTPGPIPGTFDARLPPARRPRVSIIVPTRANSETVRHCLAALVEKTVYPDLEFVVLANPPPDDAPASAFLERLPARRLDMAGKFNWSGFNNRGAAAATGEVLVFANDDLEPIAGDWVEAMLEHALRPEVGPVGAKLLYSDRRVQHAGVFLCAEGGGSRHAFRFLDADDPGYAGLACLAREVIAVTGACLMIEREKFDRLGRFDEALALVNNDIDFCLRARDRGLVSIVTPHALLFHHEGVTRQALPESEDVKLFRARWRRYYGAAGGDPYFNPNLADDRDDYAVRE